MFKNHTHKMTLFLKLTINAYAFKAYVICI